MKKPKHIEREPNVLTKVRTDGVEVFAEHPTDRNFQTRARFVVTGPALTLTELQLLPSNAAGFTDAAWTVFGQWPKTPTSPEVNSAPPSAITANLLRSVSIPLLANAARAELAEAASDTATLSALTRRQKLDLKEAASAPRGRRKPDGFFAIVASEYLAAHRRGSPKPAADVASKMSVSPATVTNWIHTARERDLLTRAGQGRSGGSMTDKGRAALRDASPADKQRYRQGQS